MSDRRSCGAYLVDGTRRCRKAPLQGERYCDSHHPTREPETGTEPRRTPAAFLPPDPDCLALDELRDIQRLAEAVIQRAVRDARGRTGVSHVDRRKHREIIAEAREWLAQGGPSFTLWVELAGADPAVVHAALVERLPVVPVAGSGS